MDTTTTPRYHVRATITIDHPEKRDSTYPRVAPGTKCPFDQSFTKQSSAVAEFEGMLRGDCDFSSEFISRVAVYADNGRGGMRCVRREVRRPRMLRVRIFPGFNLRQIAPSASL